MLFHAKLQVPKNSNKYGVPLCSIWLANMVAYCRLFEMVKEAGSGDMRLEPATKTLAQLQEVGQQRSLVFSADGTRFAAGGDVSSLSSP